jgi:sterol desaturase/sphingolipid hydroxylase (fatty acid hydroxylase superfamily)
MDWAVRAVAMVHLAYPLLVLLGLSLAWLCDAFSIPAWLISTVVVGVIAAVLATAERLIPDRHDCVALDQPIQLELAHVFTGWLLGYGAAVWLCDLVGCGVRDYLGIRFWPVSLPLAGQVAIACFIAEGTSYWQHRLFHDVPGLWRFHKIHHLGSHLNFVKSGRFHFVDIGVAAFFEYLPIILMGCPPVVLAWLSAITGAMGIVQHADVRMVTPRWLSTVLVTPAIHRLHHSEVPSESNGNYGTITTFFDLVFGTYRAPSGEWPASLGVAGERLAPTLRQQLWPIALLALALPAPAGAQALEIQLLRAFDSRLPSPSATDVREILLEANRVLRAKLPIAVPIKIHGVGEMPIEQLFREVDATAGGEQRENEVWRYDLALGPRARSFTEPEARAARLKFVQNFSLEELGNMMPRVKVRTHDAYREALEAEYHKKMSWLASLTLPTGAPLLQQPVPRYQSAMDWIYLLNVQDRFDIVMTNTLIAWDVTHSPPPHSIFHHAKLGGGAMPSRKRKALGHQAVLLNVFEEYGGVAGICRSDPAVTRSERNRIIGAVLLAHELGHALFALPDVYDHGDQCLMNSSTHNVDQRVAYRLLTARMSPCAKCEPWVRAAIELSNARQAAASGDATRAAALYERVLADTPIRLNRDYGAYMAELSVEMLPFLEKAGRAEAVARCRGFVRAAAADR